VAADQPELTVLASTGLRRGGWRVSSGWPEPSRGPSAPPRSRPSPAGGGTREGSRRSGGQPGALSSLARSCV